MHAALVFDPHAATTMHAIAVLNYRAAAMHAIVVLDRRAATMHANLVLDHHAAVTMLWLCLIIAQQQRMQF